MLRRVQHKHSLSLAVSQISGYPCVTSPLVFSLRAICCLTILIQSLDRVHGPGTLVSDVEGIDHRHADSFARLRSVMVLGTAEVTGLLTRHQSCWFSGSRSFLLSNQRHPLFRHCW
ncbi:hypothetical protein GQ54DRAFT_100256 [Martensiomyces pterosporus]|nr:hypothetical protein GQ54DRAFT_100256 [Martensiomyces pterosporus]